MSRILLVIICMCVIMLTACTFEFGGKTYEISENGVEIFDNEATNDVASEDEANQVPVVSDNTENLASEEEILEDIVNNSDNIAEITDNERVVIDGCGTDISILYRYLPEDFPIPDCITIQEDGSMGTRGETSSNYVYHFTTKKYTHEAIYDMYKDYIINNGYEIVEDRITEGFRFFDLQGKSDNYDVTVNSTFSSGEAFIGIMFTIKE